MHSTSEGYADTDAKKTLPIPALPGAYPLIGNYFDFANGMHEAMPKLVAKHGSIFSAKFPSGSKYYLPFPGPTVLLSDPKLFEEMYNRHDDFNKKHFKHSDFRQFVGQGLFTADDDEPIHDVAARILLPAFSMNGMKEYFGIITECTDILSSVFAAKAEEGVPVDLHHMLSCYTLEIIGRVGFGMKFNAMQDETNELIQLLDEFSATTIRVKAYPLKSSQAAAAIASGDLSRIRNFRTKFQAYLSKVIADKKESIAAAKACPVTGQVGECPALKDMAERMLTQADPQTGEMLPDDNIMHQVATFLVAGHDSTSTAITMLLTRLAQHPEVEERVYQEVMSIVGDGPITWDALGKMTYCTQVVKESLRMYSPATGPQKVSPVDRATTLGPYDIPPGTVLIISTWGLHYNPEVYPEPFKFDPDRWSPENAAKRSPYAWLPFSYGKRGCIGMQLSMLEQRLCLAEMVRRFHVRIHESSRLVTTEPIFLNPQGIYLSVRPRSSVVPSSMPASTLDLGTNSEHQGFKVDAAPELSGKKLQVLFGSNMGSCEDLADRILRRCEDMGMSCSKAPLDAACRVLDPVELPKGEEGLVLVITSTYNGQPPENARAFDAWLDTPEAAEKFKGVRYAVFGCGNKQWAATYMAFSMKVNTALEAMGGSMFCPFGEGDMDSGEAEFAFSRWEIAVCIALMRSHHVPVPESIKDYLYPRMPEYLVFQLLDKRFSELPHEAVMRIHVENDSRARAEFQKDAFAVKMECNRELVTAEGRSTRHIEMQLPEKVTYTAGDHLGVWAPNPPSVVIAYLDRLSVPHDAMMKVELTEQVSMSLVPSNSLLPAFVLLGWCFELQAVASRAQLRALSKLAGDEVERSRLVTMSEWNEDGDDTSETSYQVFVKEQRRTLLDILQEFSSVKIGFGQLMGMLPSNKPRYYSISSSPQKLSRSVSISVSVVQGRSPTGRVHLGHCSTFLKEYPRKVPESVHPSKDMMLYAFIKDTGSSFRLPKSPDVPVIMIGPGTGVAPMRGFIQDRVASGAKENVLFFGCRDEDDYIYREELEAWQKDGFLELHVAFSRLAGKPKTYVQNIIEAQSVRMIELVSRGAHIYVCGDASKMAPDVQQTFTKLITGAGMGEDYVDRMLEEGRYCQDVWAAQSV